MSRRPCAFCLCGCVGDWRGGGAGRVFARDDTPSLVLQYTLISMRLDEVVFVFCSCASLYISSSFRPIIQFRPIMINSDLLHPDRLYTIPTIIFSPDRQYPFRPSYSLPSRPSYPIHTNPTPTPNPSHPIHSLPLTSAAAQSASTFSVYQPAERVDTRLAYFAL